LCCHVEDLIEKNYNEEAAAEWMMDIKKVALYLNLPGAAAEVSAILDMFMKRRIWWTTNFFSSICQMQKTKVEDGPQEPTRPFCAHPWKLFPK
jgi:hypothetical protein